MSGFSKYLNEASIITDDSVLDGITYEDLLTAVVSNEKEYTEKTVTKVFNEILNTNVKDAKYTVKKNMRSILKMLEK